MREGKSVTVDVINDSDAAELVHCGMDCSVPSEVDGADEEGTPMSALRDGGGGAMNSLRGPQALAGITRMQWRAQISIGALTRGSTAF